jgi:periplasmic protein TonB
VFANLLWDAQWANLSHRGWTTLASFALQTLMAGGLLLLPLIYTQGLPQLQLTGALIAPTPPPAPPAPMSPHQAAPSVSNELPNGIVMMPSSIPREIADIHDQGAPTPAEVNAIGILGGTDDRWTNNPVINSIATAGVGNPPAVAAAPKVRPPRISRMMEANLIDRVQPDYPPLARGARIQGTVVLRAVISRDGTIENLQVVSGHPMLVRAAVDAVQRWRYRPYLLNGEPVEVETQVTVNFILSGG